MEKIGDVCGQYATFPFSVMYEFSSEFTTNSSPSRLFSKEDLPEPTGPLTPTSSPHLIFILTLFRTTCYCFLSEK